MCIPLGEHGLFRNQLLIYPAEPGKWNIPFSGGMDPFWKVPSPGPFPGQRRSLPGLPPTAGPAIPQVPREERYLFKGPQPGLPHRSPSAQPCRLKRDSLCLLTSEGDCIEHEQRSPVLLGVVRAAGSKPASKRRSAAKQGGDGFVTIFRRAVFRR